MIDQPWAVTLNVTLKGYVCGGDAVNRGEVPCFSETSSYYINALTLGW